MSIKISKRVINKHPVSERLRAIFAARSGKFENMKKSILIIVLLIGYLLSFSQETITKKQINEFIFSGLDSISQAELYIDFSNVTETYYDKLDSLYYSAETFHIYNGWIKCDGKYIPGGIYGEWNFYNENSFKIEYVLMIEPPRKHFHYKDTCLDLKIKEIYDRTYFIVTRHENFVDSLEIISIDSITCNENTLNYLTLKRKSTANHKYSP